MSAPKTAFAIRHVEFEGLGLFETILSESGYTPVHCDAWRDDLSAEPLLNADLLIVLGGPFSVHDAAQRPYLASEMRLLEHRLDADLPTIGVCLGAQLIAHALGSRVYRQSASEIGWAPVELTQSGKSSPLRHLAGLPLLHWHGETFDLPAGASHLASTSLCENQAFAIGHSILGVQFHPEVDAQQGIERWICGHEKELAADGVDPEILRAATRNIGSTTGHSVRPMLLDWLAQLPA